MQRNIMTEVLAVFRSRAQAMDCNSRLKKNGINSVLVNTPKEANIGCGLSVRIPQNVLPRAKALVSSGRYSAFYGFFTAQNLYGRTYMGRLN